jgi:hypothetical protein
MEEEKQAEEGSEESSEETTHGEGTPEDVPPAEVAEPEATPAEES